MKQIAELLSQIKLFCQFDVAVADKLEELEGRLYTVEERSKSNEATSKANRTQISELRYAFSSVKKDLSK